MTDGIIQEVFRNYVATLDNIPWDKKDLDQLQQELIEKIKKELPCLDIGISKTLIGDNQK